MHSAFALDQRELAEFIDTDGTLLFWPEELVFKDAPSRLIGANEPVVAW